MNLTSPLPFANHLWQSTVFAAAAGLLTLALRKNHARVRHGVWLAASCKFLIPISLLVALGGQIRWWPAPPQAASSVILVMDEVSQPFAVPPAPSRADHPAPRAANPLPAIFGGFWGCGFLGISSSWWIRWRRLRNAVRRGSPVPLGLPIRAVSSGPLVEPGVFGVFRPVLLLPEGIDERLTPAQFEAVVAHELCHVRHRDNLTAAIHMFVETVFWFYPLVWWIGKRIVEEREQACDEEVLRLGSEPSVYAEGILNICKSYLALPLACASGVTGAGLKRRIEAIMDNRAARPLDIRGRALLIAAGLVAFTGPIAVGVLGASPRRGQTQAETAPLAFEAASVRPHPDTNGRRDRTRSIEPGRITYMDTTLGDFIAMAYGVKRYQISAPNWIVGNSSAVTFDVVATAGKPVSVEQVKRMLGPLLAERFHLVFHRETHEVPVYALVLAKGGPKFKEPGDSGPYSISPDGEGGLAFKNWSMEDLADWLTGIPSMGRPVIDHTGLAGSFSFRANLFGLDKGTPPDELKRSMINGDAVDAVRAALPDQLGLKLESQKASLEVLIIDHADKVPTAN